jgi:ketosteroid isomerase-like protein
MAFVRVALLAFLLAPGLHAQSFSGTWFGSIAMTTPDHKVQHDTAVLVLQQQGGGVTGSLGRTIDQQSPISAPQRDGSTLRFHLDAAGGLDFTLRATADGLAGTADGASVTAELSLRPAPGLLPHDALVAEVRAADAALFHAFETCDVAAYGRSLAKDLEFYQDRTGRTDYAENLQALRQRCEEGIHLRRELDDSSLVINAVPGFGAIEAGTHLFYARNPDGTEHLDATARFTTIWSKQSGTWQAVRTISYDHR